MLLESNEKYDTPGFFGLVWDVTVTSQTKGVVIFIETRIGDPSSHVFAKYSPRDLGRSYVHRLAGYEPRTLHIQESGV